MTRPPGLAECVEATLTSPVVLGAAEAGDTLTYLLRALEVASGDQFLVSILLLDKTGESLRSLVAPSLPEAYCEAINGASVGPSSGSCGTAAYYGHAIFVTDIEHDPHWADWRDVALAHGLCACWSTPINDTQGKLIGTFAIYHREPRSPTDSEVKAIAFASAALSPLISQARK